MNKKEVKKVIIPAAGWGTRFLPQTKVVHKELIPILNKPILHYLAKEAIDAGIEELILVVSPKKLEILNYFNENIDLQKELKKKKKVTLLKTVEETNNLIKISVAIQNEQLGLGHAILVAANFIEDEPFGVMLGDNLVDSNKPAIKQLIEAYKKTRKTIIGVQQVGRKELHKYGVVKPKDKVEKRLFKISGAIEKPSTKEAPSNMAIYGRYVFTPLVMKLLSDLKPGKGNEINLTDTFAKISKIEGIYAYEFEGKKYDLGSTEGFVKANIDFALKDKKIKNSIIEHIKKIK